MKRARRSGRAGRSDRWVLPYADLVTLLFGFFVVMYAVSALDAKRLARVSSGLRAAFAAV